MRWSVLTFTFSITWRFRQMAPETYLPSQATFLFIHRSSLGPVCFQKSHFRALWLVYARNRRADRANQFYSLVKHCVITTRWRSTCNLLILVLDEERSCWFCESLLAKSYILSPFYFHIYIIQFPFEEIYHHGKPFALLHILLFLYRVHFVRERLKSVYILILSCMGIYPTLKQKCI